MTNTVESIQIVSVQLEETRRLLAGPLGSSIYDTETVFAAAPRHSFSSFVPKSGQSCNMSRVQCNYCKDFGHMKFTCSKLKKSHPTTAAHHSTATSASPVVLACAKSPSSSTLPVLDIQDMITKALSGLGQGIGSVLGEGSCDRA
ncbi:hypothetical protein H6P81_003923 [Aristolochia fimbriata]|uniref:Uncharacterized protein n=1 Tax=Aristolochia fimbriata TaxID=158543 RepID=A0AAV7FGR0_ARIFI|nr:hypothetical protein H6P81_003923 [Aristolochia fimbriata]